MFTTNKLQLPPVIFGTSCLGNLYEAVPYEIKLAIIKECINPLAELKSKFMLYSSNWLVIYKLVQEL